MVLCIVALPVFAILGIFSLKYRKLAKESLECVFRTAAFKKCRSGLDERIKSSMSGAFLRFSPKIAGMIYKNYKIISWVLLLAFALSAYGASVGIYNYINYGNCNGPEDTGFCLLDPTGSNSAISELDNEISGQPVLPQVEANDPIMGNKDAQLTIIEFGCYACPYTKKAEPIMQEVLEYYKGKVNLQFKTMVIPRHNMSYQAALSAECAIEQGKYIEYHNLLFEEQESLSHLEFEELAKQSGMDVSKFMTCLNSEKYKKEVDSDTAQGYAARVSGTPTFFINGQRVTGPKPFRTFKTIINRELKT